MKNNLLVRMIVYCTAIVAVLSVAAFKSIPDNNLHVVFCDVGQGDAIYIKLPDGKDVLFDGGPNSDVLNCIGDHMSFWDRTIELIILTHPQYDHFKGLTEVISRYNVDLLIAPPIENEAKSYQAFKDIVRLKEVQIRNPYAGESLLLFQNEAGEKIELTFLWPEYDWVADNIDSSNRSDRVINKDILGITTTHDNLNDFSIVANISYRLFDVLLTGDAESKIIQQLIDRGAITSNDIEVYKIGHHGANAGLSQEVAKYIKPDLAVISVGKNNQYDHPRQEVLDILGSLSIPVMRTDLNGGIEIVSDGERWWVE